MTQTSKPKASLFVHAFRQLKSSNPLRLAGATAFFTTFALPPLFIILLQLFGLVLNKENTRTEMLHALADVIGHEGSMQIQVIMRGMTSLAVNPVAGVLGFIFLLFVATTLFKVIRDSIDELWAIRLAPSSGITTQLVSRVKSLGVIGLAGLLFIASLFFDGMQSIVGHYIQEYSGVAAAWLAWTVNKLFSLLIVTVWFTLLFRHLPDGTASNRATMVGGLVTGVLFTIGKVVLRFALPYKDITSVFGAAGAFVLVLLFVFYSSFILYYGACFIQAYARLRQQPIRPKAHAVSYEWKETV